MATKSSKQVTFVQKGRSKCPPSCARLIYDEPYIFRVRSERQSSHIYPCESCLKKAQRQASSANNRYPKRCSRLPPEPTDFEYFNRSYTSLSKRTPNDCNWDNFMKNKSRYAIPTPYAQCNLTNYEQESENRPPLVNYGGGYNDKSFGEKRTFNSLAVHQLKHHEVDEERLRSFLREQRLRQEAENYFREMERRRFHGHHRHSSTEYRHNHQE